MKKNNKKIFILVCLILLLFTGCTKRFTITDEETKKSTSYVTNIVCKPEDKTLQEVYETNAKDQEINYSSLPKCSKFKITSGGYEGLWTSIFVKPLAWLLIKLGLLVKNYGLSIIIIGFVLRLALFPISKKSTMMSENMKKAKPELEKLEKKYSNKTDKDSMMMKSQEMMVIYKKYDINPMSSCLFAFLQLPILFAFLEAVYRVPVLFEGTFLKLKLGTTPLQGLQSGQWWYLIIVALIVLTTYFSMKNMNTGSMDAAQAQQMKIMNMFMLVFIPIMSFNLPIAIALYWIVSSGFTVIQNFLLKKSLTEPQKKKKIKVKKESK